jgi:hypothetical protein
MHITGKSFHQDHMAIYLSADEIGADLKEIGYPHLRSCMGVTLVMGDGSLIGASFGTAAAAPETAARLQALIQSKPGMTIRCMYVTGDFPAHERDGGCDPMGKAQLIGYHGKIACFDTSAAGYAEGAFVKLTSQGPVYAAVVEYKPDDRMNYETSGLPGGAVIGAVTLSGKDLHRAKLKYLTA